MVLNCNKLLLLLYIYLCFIYCVTSERTFEKRVAKRSENDFQMCLDNFDIHTDKIIRTQDSKAMGAKYINEIDVASREECLRVCCETDNCDVLVFEEKSPGSCYLFECGSPEDFKCKFTKHKNYTSAVLAINRHLTDLESQIKITQHEHELTKLRDPQVESSEVRKTTTSSPETKESIQLIPSQTSQQQNSTCSRFQFACHSKGECIAIYNACDGIPQCSDGSDEAPELGCPAILSTTTTTIKPPTYQSPNDKVVKEKNAIPQLPPGSYQGDNNQRKWTQQQQLMSQYSEGDNVQGPVSYQRNQPQGPNQDMGPNVNYGREGEGLAYGNGQNMWPYQYHQNSGGSQIFTHKGNGLVQQAERYPQHPYKPQEPQMNINPYNDQPNDIKYNYDASQYRNPYPQNAPANWQPHRPHNLDQPENVMDETIMNRNPDSNRGMIPPDYFYDESYRNRAPQPQRPLSYPHTQHMGPQVETPPKPQKAPIKPEEGIRKSEQQPKPETSRTETVTVSHGSTSTAKPKVAETHHPNEHKSHRKLEKLSAEVSLIETKFGGPDDEKGVNPSGAILSLTFGLLITGIMVVLVGCRMRMVHRRMRRGGKSPYAHDADFLVNGMYL